MNDVNPSNGGLNSTTTMAQDRHKWSEVGKRLWNQKKRSN